MIYEKRPLGFKPKFEIVSCYLICQTKLLVVQRDDADSEGGKWAFPGGTLEKGETLKEAMFREIKEEIGIRLKDEDIAYLKKIYVKYPKKDFIYHMFYAELKDMPQIKLNKELKGYLWLSSEEALRLNLVNGGKKCIELFIKLTQK